MDYYWFSKSVEGEGSEKGSILNRKVTFTGMTWQKEPPTETGWYWAYSSQQRMAMVIRVDLLHPREKLVPMWGSEPDKWEYFTHWLGPLPMPTPPEEE